jgi:hypothetical protein
LTLLVRWRIEQTQRQLTELTLAWDVLTELAEEFVEVAGAELGAGPVLVGEQQVRAELAPGAALLLPGRLGGNLAAHGPVEL